ARATEPERRSIGPRPSRHDPREGAEAGEHGTVLGRNHAGEDRRRAAAGKNCRAAVSITHAATTGHAATAAATRGDDEGADQRRAANTARGCRQPRRFAPQPSALPARSE